MTTRISSLHGLSRRADLERPANLEGDMQRAILDREQTAWALTALKQRLLRATLPAGGDAGEKKLLQLAAGEAEALAWLTPFPLLFLPVLLEEKLNGAKSYVARQRRVGSPRWAASCEATGIMVRGREHLEPLAHGPRMATACAA